MLGSDVAAIAEDFAEIARTMDRATRLAWMIAEARLADFQDNHMPDQAIAARTEVLVAIIRAGSGGAE